MTKKNVLIRVVIFMVLLAMVIPSLVVRLNYEKDNNDVVFALSLNSAKLYLSPDEVDKSVDENKAVGVNTIFVGEETVNTLVNNGFVTAIKYGVLCHKYDDESEDIIKALEGNDKVGNESYIIITKRDEWKEHLKKWVSAKFTKDEFKKIELGTNADAYVIYEGVNDTRTLALGFEEEKFAYAKEKGCDIILSMMLGTYSTTDYVKEVQRLIDEYDIKYINLKKNSKDRDTDKTAEKNYNAFCDLIKKNDIYLVLTEEQTQLSNQKPVGYEKLLKAAGGKVIRGYETIDVDSTNVGPTIFDKRSHQIINSVVDRNIRVVIINQIINGSDSFEQKSEKTNLATKTAVDKLNEIGFNTASYDKVYENYTPYRTLTGVSALLIMILMGITCLEWLFAKRFKKLEILAATAGVLGAVFTCVAPQLVLWYPTLYAMIAPCFALTAVMVFVREVKGKLKPWIFTVASVAFTVVVLFLCATVQTALLAGLDYYLNSLIFRGIKISLILPIVYSFIVYGMIFGDPEESIITKIKKVMTADVKVYWVLMGVVFAGAAAIYLIRSGNVEKISGFETFMRNTITDIMPARPRTKEFLVGWPCLVLFFYYVKNTECTVLRWCFSVGSSILFASVINSFCHVFTSAEVIYTRVFNGFFVGMLISVALLVVNYIVIAFVKKYVKEGQ